MIFEGLAEGSDAVDFCLKICNYAHRKRGLWHRFEARFNNCDKLADLVVLVVIGELAAENRKIELDLLNTASCGLGNAANGKDSNNLGNKAVAAQKVRPFDIAAREIIFDLWIFESLDPCGQLLLDWSVLESSIKQFY